MLVGLATAGCGRIGFAPEGSAIVDASSDAQLGDASPDATNVACPSQIRLDDGFDSGLPSSQWEIRIGPQMSVTQTGGVVRFSFGQPSPAGAESSYRQMTAASLREGCVVAELVTVPANGAEAFLAVETATARLRFKVEADKLEADDDVASVDAPYVAAMHRFLRIRDVAGTALWETSSDGTSFVPFHSAPAPDLASAQIELGASTDTSVSGGAVEFAKVLAVVP